MRRTLLLFFLISTLGCTGISNTTNENGLGPSNSEADLNVALNTGKPVLLEFYAEWCQYCKQEKPIIDGLKEEYKGKVIVLKIDVDQNPGLMEAMTGQDALPTLVVFDRDGHITTWWIGFTEKDKIVGALSGL